MVEEHPMGEAPNASQARQGQQVATPQRSNGKAGEQTGQTKWEQELQEMKERVKFTMESCRGWLGSGPKGKAVMDNLGPVLEFIQALTQKKSREAEGTENGKRDKTMEMILNRLDKMEKGLAREPTRPVTGNVNPKALWSEVAVGGKTKAVVEVRMNSVEGAEDDSPEEKLQKIKMAIPDAKAIITHPRAKGKISVVVPSLQRRDQIIATGITEHENIKLIRKPKLVMVMGIPIHTNITTGDSEDNKTWAKVTSAQNAIKIERVTWLYKKDKLEKIRKAGSQKKGSIIVEVATEDDRTRLVKEGMLHGALWLPAKIWDAAMQATQCFKSVM